MAAPMFPYSTPLLISGASCSQHASRASSSAFCSWNSMCLEVFHFLRYMFVVALSKSKGVGWRHWRCIAIGLWCVDCLALLLKQACFETPGQLAGQLACQLARKFCRECYVFLDKARSAWYSFFTLGHGRKCFVVFPVLLLEIC